MHLRRTFIVICLLLATASANSLESKANSEVISFKLNSWGKPLFSWTISPDGIGFYAESSPIAGKGFYDYHWTVRSIAVGPDGYSKIQRLMTPARALAKGSVECGERMTDLPYGSVSWQSPTAKLDGSFDTGCSSAAMRPIISSIQQAHNQVAEWSGKAKITEEKDVLSSHN